MVLKGKIIAKSSFLRAPKIWFFNQFWEYVFASWELVSPLRKLANTGRWEAYFNLGSAGQIDSSDAFGRVKNNLPWLRHHALEGDRVAEVHVADVGPPLGQTNLKNVALWKLTNSLVNII